MHLIYLHIEKSAGTSQRELFWRNYGKDRVAWKGLDFPTGNRRGLLEFRERPVLGGHMDYPEARALAGTLLFTSVVREPVSRAVSLFNFWSRNAPEDQRRTWRSRGLDPESMLATIRGCGRFRKAISDSQCIRLSGSRRFEDCMQIMGRENFIVGTFDRLNEFNDRLAGLLAWSRADLGRFNEAGSSSYQDSILAEEGLREAIEDLVGEDRKLFEWLDEQGLYEHLPDGEALVEGLSAGGGTTDAPPAGGVVLTVIGDSRVAGREPADIRVRIENFGPDTLVTDGDHPAVLGYHWIDRASGKPLEEGTRSRLSEEIPPGARGEVTLRVLPPRRADPEQARIRISVLRVGDHWLATRDPSHGLILDPVAA